MIHFYKHNLKKNKNYLKKALNSLYLTSGPISENVERLISERFNKKYCYLTNSWTNGLISILMSINLKKDDEVIVPACTFVACANVVEMVGGKVVFADIDEKTKLLDVEDCIKKITKKTKVIMPVHLYGNLFDSRKLKKKIATKKKIFIIEDCAHTFYGLYPNYKPLGYYSDFAVFSFYATKNITCGEGGAIISNHKNLMEKIKSISNNGMTKPAFKRFVKKKYVPWDVKQVGFKANLSDVNASLLEEQVINYSKLRNNRKKIFDQYIKAFKNINDIFFPKSSFVNRDFHLFPIGVNEKYRDKLIEYLLKKNIFVTVNYKSITQLNYYKNKYKIKKNTFPKSEKWSKQTLSLPFHQKLEKKDINFISKVITGFFNK